MHRLAHFCIDRLRAPLAEIPSVGFEEQLELLMLATETADGFVWRSDDMPTENPCAIARLTVWRSPAALDSFVRGPVHRPFRLRSDEWFEPRRDPHEVVWWVSSLRTPTVGEAIDRLRTLRTTGPTLRAFTLDDRFPPN